MAEDLVNRGKSKELIDFARHVIVAQNAEIRILSSFLTKADQTPLAKAERFNKELNGSMQPMMNGVEAVNLSGKVEQDFLALMIPHHQGAVEMAKAYLPYADNKKLKKMAKDIIRTQDKEINWLKSR